MRYFTKAQLLNSKICLWHQLQELEGTAILEQVLQGIVKIVSWCHKLWLHFEKKFKEPHQLMIF